MKSSLFIVALAASANGSLFARTAQSILADIASISTKVGTLKSSLDAYKGDVASAVPVTTAQTALDTAIKQGTTDAKATSTLNEADTTSILNAITSLIPLVISSVNAFVAKQPQFVSAGLGGIATTDLAMLQTDTNDFSNALVAIAAAPSQAAASAAKSCIDAAFSSAVAGSTATSCGGAVSPATSSSAAGSSSSSAAAAATTSSGSTAATVTAASTTRSVAATSATSASAAATTTHSGSSASYKSATGLWSAVLAFAAAFVV